MASTNTTYVTQIQLKEKGAEEQEERGEKLPCKSKRDS